MGKQISPWFEQGFSDELKKWILSNWPENPSLRCQVESRRWAARILTFNPVLDLEIHEGFFYVQGDLNKAEGHMWLVLDDCIFDPTVSQFKGMPDYDNYETHQYYDGAQLLQHLEEYGLKPKKQDGALHPS